jgi:hypothetical protein
MGLGTYSRVFGVRRQYVKGLGIAIVGWMYGVTKTKETRIREELPICYLRDKKGKNDRCILYRQISCPQPGPARGESMTSTSN